jgi:hypothetical protein
MNPTIMYEDNATCIAQMRAGYIKSNLTKHMAPKLFYPHQLQKVGSIYNIYKGEVTMEDSSPLLFDLHLHRRQGFMAGGEFSSC